MSGRGIRKYVVIFLEHHGEGPWSCYFCGEPITCFGLATRDGQIHHHNEDRSDDRIENLAITHTVCHRRHHQVGKSRPSEVVAKMAATRTGMTYRRNGYRHSAETRKKIGDANRLRKGYRHSDETKARMQAAARRVVYVRVPCPYCDDIITRPGPLKSHIKSKHKEFIT